MSQLGQTWVTLSFGPTLGPNSSTTARKTLGQKIGPYNNDKNNNNNNSSKLK